MIAGLVLYYRHLKGSALGQPLISIIIVTYNSADYISNCLARLKAQTYRDFEVILIDNRSTDNSMEILDSAQEQLSLTLIQLENNIGFAAANNLGASKAKGHWLATLNPDAFPEPDWLANLVTTATENPGCFFASRLIQASHPSWLDGEGDAYHISGVAWRRGHGSLVGELPVHKCELIEVFSSCAAAALYPRTAFLELGGFDEGFFAYHEDVDLGFRLRLHGLRCLYAPAAVVFHQGSASMGKESDFVIYHGHRNLVWTYFKNMPLVLLLLFLPLHLAMNFYFLFSFGLKGRGAIIWEAKKDALIGLAEVLSKRKAIHKKRSASTLSLLSSMDIDFRSLLKARRDRKNIT